MNHNMFQFKSFNPYSKDVYTEMSSIPIAKIKLCTKNDNIYSQFYENTYDNRQN